MVHGGGHGTAPGAQTPTVLELPDGQYFIKASFFVCVCAVRVYVCACVRVRVLVSVAAGAGADLEHGSQPNELLRLADPRPADQLHQLCVLLLGELDGMRPRPLRELEHRPAARSPQPAEIANEQWKTGSYRNVTFMLRDFPLASTASTSRWSSRPGCTSGRVAGRNAWWTVKKGSVLATKAVGTQGKGQCLTGLRQVGCGACGPTKVQPAAPPAAAASHSAAAAAGAGGGAGGAASGAANDRGAVPCGEFHDAPSVKAESGPSSLGLPAATTSGGGGEPRCCRRSARQSRRSARPTAAADPPPFSRPCWRQGRSGVALPPSTPRRGRPVRIGLATGSPLAPSPAAAAASRSSCRRRFSSSTCSRCSAAWAWDRAICRCGWTCAGHGVLSIILLGAGGRARRGTRHSAQGGGRNCCACTVGSPSPLPAPAPRPRTQLCPVLMRVVVEACLPRG